MRSRNSDTTGFSSRSVADFLLQRFASGKVAVPELPGPQTRVDAYAVQDRVAAGLGPVKAWKVGRAKDIAEPYCAPIPQSRVVVSGAGYTRRDGVARLEAELGLRIGQDIGGISIPLSQAECLNLVDAVVPAIEILETRLAGAPATGAMWKLADLQGNGGLVLGHPAPWTGQDLRTPWLAIESPGQALAPAVEAKHPFGDPLELLTWTVNHVAAKRGGLSKGDVIITGSYCGILDVSESGLFLAAFNGFAPVSLQVD